MTTGARIVQASASWTVLISMPSEVHSGVLEREGCQTHGERDRDADGKGRQRERGDPDRQLRQQEGDPLVGGGMEQARLQP